MTSFMARVAWPAVIAVLSTVVPVAAQDGPELPEQYREPISLLPEALGPYAFKISSANEEAQQFFDQGMQLMFSFAKVDAVRSFRESWTRDPDCAICYWGEAWALAPYLNGGMSPGNERKAYAAIERAKELSSHASEIEQARINQIVIYHHVRLFEAALTFARKQPRISRSRTNEIDFSGRHNSRELEAPNAESRQATSQRLLLLCQVL